MLDPNSKIFERFSNNNWVLISSKAFVCPGDFEVISHQKWENTSFIKLLKEDDNWKEQRLKIATSPVIKQHYIIDGEIFNYPVGNELLKLFSKHCSLYYFHIDLWIPSMSFEFYENGTVTRSYKVHLQPNKNQTDVDFTEESFGKLLPTEQVVLSEFAPEDPDYNYFWFPMRFIAQEFNISIEDINKVFSKKATVVKVSKVIENNIDSE